MNPEIDLPPVSSLLLVWETATSSATGSTPDIAFSNASALLPSDTADWGASFEDGAYVWSGLAGSGSATLGNFQNYTTISYSSAAGDAEHPWTATVVKGRYCVAAASATSFAQVWLSAAGSAVSQTVNFLPQSGGLNFPGDLIAFYNNRITNIPFLDMFSSSGIKAILAPPAASPPNPALGQTTNTTYSYLTTLKWSLLPDYVPPDPTDGDYHNGRGNGFPFPNAFAQQM